MPSFFTPTRPRAHTPTRPHAHAPTHTHTHTHTLTQTNTHTHTCAVSTNTFLFTTYLIFNFLVPVTLRHPVVFCAGRRIPLS
jgi:hypothetical protein